MDEKTRWDGVTVVEHPLLAHLLTRVRDRETPSAVFRQLIAAMGRFLCYEAMRGMRVEAVEIETPLETFKGSRLAEPVTLVPILRAGLGLADRLLGMVPGAAMGHIGMFRDEAKLEPVSYYEKLPAQATRGPVLVLDPMLATGGSAVAAVDLLKKRGCSQITFVCVLASPEGVSVMREKHGDVPIVTAAVDRELDERGYILPGLGDAGDRVFGTGE
ncbi:MAG: uracil phosphoribosyltransferase [Planctomycetota bacterium]